MILRKTACFYLSIICEATGTAVSFESASGTRTALEQVRKDKTMKTKTNVKAGIIAILIGLLLPR